MKFLNIYLELVILLVAFEASLLEVIRWREAASISLARRLL